MDSFKAELIELEKRRDADNKRHAQDALDQKRNLDEHVATFQKRAERTLSEIIQPRLELLSGYFPDIKIHRENDVTIRATFNTKREFAATVWLEFSQNLELERNRLSLHYQLEILPIFFEFDRMTGMSCSLEDPDDTSLTTFVEARLTEFMKLYMRLEQTKAYQQVESNDTNKTVVS